ncbi:MAG: SAM-dependent methyltransferase [Acidobacteria bacterium]|nr:MAG: SAM-dependent methyltransferase [Acidobacteriota bacterium]
MMTLESLKDRKQVIIDKFGPWTASNIHFGDHSYTIGEHIQGDEIKVRRILQIVSDIATKPLEAIRLVDLACHEGQYAIEFARHGANALGIEGREVHIQKALFAKEVLSLSNVNFVKDDVRNLSKQKYGSFDVVLCLGILYHLDVPDVFTFVERIAEVCDDIAVIDTRIAPGPTSSYLFNGTRYWGNSISEGHKATDTPQTKIARYWASLDNVKSFHLSRTSLYCLLSRVGFTSVYECHIPPECDKPIDRITLVAIKGRRQRVINSPLMEEYPATNVPEEFNAHKIERLYGRVYRAARLLLPEKARVAIKSHGFLGRLFRPFKPNT